MPFTAATGEIIAVPKIATFATARLAERRPSPRLTLACRILAEQMFLSCRRQRVWDGSPYRCYWYAHSAAAYLRLAGFVSYTRDAILCVDLAGGEDGSVGFMHIGTPVDGQPGMHSVAVVTDADGRTWLLETSLFQTHRRRFHPMPDMMLVERDPGASSPEFSDLGYSLAAFAEWPNSPDGRECTIRWFMAAFTSQGGGDCDPERGEKVARHIVLARGLPES